MFIRIIPRSVLIALFIGFCPGIAIAEIKKSPDLQPEPYYVPHIEFGGYYFSDTPHTAGVLRGFLPIGIDDRDHLLYIDARSIAKKGGEVKEGNLGLGYRQLNEANTKLHGVYGFFDRKRTASGAFFSQFTFGLEYWHNKFFTGGNFYMPIGARFVTQSTSNASAALTQNSPGIFNILVTTSANSSTEIALIGADFSLGHQFGENLIAYLGVYHYNSSSRQYSCNAVQGPMLNLEYIFYPETNIGIGLLDRITGETQVQYDSVRGGRFYAGLRLSIAFGTRSLTGIRRRMVDPAFRDIDVVLTTQQANSTFTELAKNSQGSTIQVNQVSDSTAANALIGNTNATVIAVSGTITNFNSGNATLAQWQEICGGNYEFIYNGQPLSVQVADNGVIQSVSGSDNLVKVSKNNSIQDITLTMINPNNNAAGNIAIQADASSNDLGTLTIDSVTSNGRISIIRTGASQTGNVLIYNSTFSSPNTWNPTGAQALGNFNVSNGANLYVDIDNCTFSTSATNSIVGLRFQPNANNSKITIGAIKNSTIASSGSGIDINIGGNIAGGTAQVIFEDGIYNSNINPNNAGQVAIHVHRVGANTASFEMSGGIQNNVIKCPNVNMEGILIADDTNTVLPFNATVSKGFINNSVTTVNTSNISLSASRAADTYNITNFYSNQLTLGAGNGRISLNAVTATSVINIAVGNGSTGLSASNNNATLLITGSGTKNITPGQ